MLVFSKTRKEQNQKKKQQQQQQKKTFTATSGLVLGQIAGDGGLAKLTQEISHPAYTCFCIHEM
jgi:hypothetical protein